ncbi:MAG TPA: hypothetical protein VFH71_05085 [Rhodanobacteraceae bacterium]|nr:hypothetical protein [Rhodanobacteraceae bacterium]
MLRHVISHLRRQDWMAVTIELVIVILGVFIGLQVSNWNQARADADLGKDYVTRLTSDLEEDLAGVRAEGAYYRAVLESLRKTDELLREPDANPRTLVVNAYRATEIIYTPPVRATWDQIVSSGHLGLLPARAVESGLSQYFAFDTAQDLYNTGWRSDYRRTVREIIPLGMQMAMHRTCSDVRDEGGRIVGFAEHCEFEADPIALKAVAAALRGDPAVAASLRYQYSFVVNATTNLGRLKANIEDALGALGAGPVAAARATPDPARAAVATGR